MQGANLLLLLLGALRLDLVRGALAHAEPTPMQYSRPVSGQHRAQVLELQATALR